jgi:hypothetical protein
MSRAKLVNNAVTTLASPVTTTTQTNITVASAVSFPALGAGEYLYATLTDASNVPEIVKVTGIVSNVMTVVRGQDGTAARTFSAGAVVALNLVSVVLMELAPLTGEGSSGTWPISISGNAAHATSATAADLATDAQHAVEADHAATADLATNATSSDSSASASQLGSTNWTIQEVAGVLVFKYQGVTKAKLSSTGVITAVDVTAGTP